MAELVDAHDSKSCILTGVWVRVPLPAQNMEKIPTKLSSHELGVNYGELDNEYKKLYEYTSKNKLPYDSAEFQRLSEIADSLWWKCVENLPEIKEGWSRLLHKTGSVEVAQSIAKSGLKFNEYLDFTVYVTKDMKSFFVAGKQEASSIEETGIYLWQDGTSVVFDVPDSVLKEYQKLKEGILPAKYLASILPERTPIVYKDDKVLLPSERIAAIQI